MATRRRHPGPGLIRHSDCGIPHAGDEYRRLLQLHGMVSSMSRSGNYLDNAVAEGFVHTLKKECLLNWRDMSAREVKHDMVDYIEIFTIANGYMLSTAISVQTTSNNYL